MKQTTTSLHPCRRLALEVLESRQMFAPLVADGARHLFIDDRSPVFVAPDATASYCPSYDGDELTITLAGGADDGDELSIASSDRLRVVGINTILYDGVEIGHGNQILPASGETPVIVISLNASATQASVEALLHQLTFRSTAEHPSTQVRTVVYELAETIPSQSLVYKQAGGVDLHLDVFKPVDWTASDQRPAVLFFHGGGWVSGRAQQFKDQASYLASRGMVAINVEYRLLPSQPHGPPIESIQDAKSAVRWVREHAAELGIDPDRIAAGGGSAGGHLAAAAGMIDGLDAPSEDLSISSKPNALILISAVVDNGPGGYGYSFFGDAYRTYSPAYNISPDDPPVLFMHGGADHLVPGHLVSRFAANLQAAGVPVGLVEFPEAEHGFFVYGAHRGETFRATMLRTDAFLQNLGWLSGSATIPKTQATRFAEGGLPAIGKNYSQLQVATAVASDPPPMVAPTSQPVPVTTPSPSEPIRSLPPTVVQAESQIVVSSPSDHSGEEHVAVRASARADFTPPSLPELDDELLAMISLLAEDGVTAKRR